MKRIGCRWMLLAACASALSAWLLGCDGTAVQGDTSIDVTPASNDLTGPGASVVLKAVLPEPLANSTFSTNTTLFLPLSWSVTDPSLGQVLDARGDTVVYVSNGTVGNNVVIVRDKSGREGLVGIHQLKEEPEASSAALSTPLSTVNIEAAPVAPVAPAAPVAAP